MHCSPFSAAGGMVTVNHGWGCFDGPNRGKTKARNGSVVCPIGMVQSSNLSGPSLSSSPFSPIKVFGARCIEVVFWGLFSKMKPRPKNALK